MKFKTLNNKEIRLEVLPSHYPMKSRSQCKSAGQYLLGCTLRVIYGAQAIILEEFSIPEERLFLDFYLPHHSLAFEFHGIQHDEFNKFFHNDKQGFDRAQVRDQRKRDWCALNEIVLVEVRDTLSIEELQLVIAEARASQ